MDVEAAESRADSGGWQCLAAERNRSDGSPKVIGGTWQADLSRIDPKRPTNGVMRYALQRSGKLTHLCSPELTQTA